METQQLSPGKFSVNYGLVLGIILIIIMVVMYATGLLLEGAQWPMIIYYVIFPAFIIYAINQYKKQLGGFLSLSQALKVGVATAVISALVYGVYNIIFNYFIDPEFIEKSTEMVREKLYDNPNMTEEMIDNTINTMKKFSNPLLGSAIWIGLSAIFGLIYSLIGGLVMKKEA